MYLFFGLLILFFIICLLFNFHRRKKICKKICCMDKKEKCATLNSITEPFGFSYDAYEDLFVSTVDAWQKTFGYCRLYDEAAASMSMVFDCEPIYFPYRNRTWLIEFWKGQYGINTGAEVGIYYANSLLKEKELSTTLFQSIAESEMLPVSIKLINEKGCTIFSYAKPHWWLACFRMGLYSEPEDLRLKISISFPNEEMRNSYINGLFRAGYRADEITVFMQTVSLCFSIPNSPQPLHSFRHRLAQWQNRCFVRIYLFFTRPFCQTLDRLLYLYYFAPRIFRKALCSRSRKRHIHKKTLKKFSKKNF